MMRIRLRLIGLLVPVLSLATTGCVDAIEQGLVEGLRTGSSALVQGIFGAIAAAIGGIIGGAT